MRQPTARLARRAVVKRLGREAVARIIDKVLREYGWGLKLISFQMVLDEKGDTGVMIQDEWLEEADDACDDVRVLILIA